MSQVGGPARRLVREGFFLAEQGPLEPRPVAEADSPWRERGGEGCSRALAWGSGGPGSICTYLSEQANS